MKKILIIEDDDILLGMYSQRLKSENYEILQAREGKTGLGIAQSSKPDLILLDVMLPGGMNGFDVLEDLKRSEASKNIPVIVLTNLDSEEKAAIAIGANAYLVKVNTKIEQLVEKVKEILYTENER